MKNRITIKHFKRFLQRNGESYEKIAEYSFKQPFGTFRDLPEIDLEEYIEKKLKTKPYQIWYCLFIASQTTEGFEYWHKLNQKWIKYVNKKNEEKD